MAELVVAGIICVVLGFGHLAIGVVWVLPGLAKDQLPETPFGSRSMTMNMLRIAWYIVTIFVLALAVILFALAWIDDVDPTKLMLRTFAVMWLVATAVGLWVTGPPSRRSLRLPVPFLWVIVAALCWKAAS